jgi:hypothetical protein
MPGGTRYHQLAGLDRQALENEYERVFQGKAPKIVFAPRFELTNDIMMAEISAGKVETFPPMFPVPINMGARRHLLGSSELQTLQNTFRHYYTVPPYTLSHTVLVEAIIQAERGEGAVAASVMPKQPEPEPVFRKPAQNFNFDQTQEIDRRARVVAQNVFEEMVPKLIFRIDDE